VWSLSLPANIRLGCVLLTVPNTLAYYSIEHNAASKGFIVQAPAFSRKHVSASKVAALADFVL
jgi:hypothetical protein